MIQKKILFEKNIYVPRTLALEDIALTHELDYVSRVSKNLLTEKEKREIGLPEIEKFSQRAFFASAGTLLTGKVALEKGIALNTAGGSHHASSKKGSGFCIFNDVAVAINCLLFKKILSRVLVLDLDVHQGDGTAEIFDSNNNVCTISVHCEKNFPARKVPSNIDIPLPVKTSDYDYLEAVETVLRTIKLFKPDLVFYIAGVDVHEDDDLGLLKVTSEGIRLREKRIISFFKDSGIPIAVTLGGGYQKDTTKLAFLHSLIFEEAFSKFLHI